MTSVWWSEDWQLVGDSVRPWRLPWCNSINNKRWRLSFWPPGPLEVIIRTLDLLQWTRKRSKRVDPVKGDVWQNKFFFTRFVHWAYFHFVKKNFKKWWFHELFFLEFWKVIKIKKNNWALKLLNVKQKFVYENLDIFALPQHFKNSHATCATAKSALHTGRP